MYRLLLCCVFLMCCTTDSARILGVFPWPAYSHYAPAKALLVELANRGHQVTVLTSLPQKPPVKNLRDIDLSAFFKSMKEDNTNFFEIEGTNPIMGDIFLNTFMMNATAHFFRSDQVQELLNSKEEFDVVIVEDFAAHAIKGFAHRFKAPLIMVSSIGISKISCSQVGNPFNPSYSIDFSLSYAGSMSFFQRLYSSFTYILYQLFKNTYLLPQHNDILQKHLPGAPHINEIYYNVSLLLVNSHESFHQAIPYVPNVIPVGGIHVEPPKKLPKDIQEYLDTAQNGVIFFSMGSNLKSTHLPREKREAIVKALGKLKQHVLWKWEDENLPGKPSNVKIGKWLPQSDILAHPNVMLFITHGGLQSQIETVHRGVPVLGIPIYGDQKMNMANAELNGIGVTVPYSQLTEELFTSRLNEVLTDPKYRENAKMRSKILHDQPMTPLERGVFWVEYVLRHKGAPHLRTAALDLAWYQYLLLDVALFLFITALIVMFTSYLILKKLICSRRNCDKNAKRKKD